MLPKWTKVVVFIFAAHAAHAQIQLGWSQGGLHYAAESDGPYQTTGSMVASGETITWQATSNTPYFRLTFADGSTYADLAGYELKTLSLAGRAPGVVLLEFALEPFPGNMTAGPSWPYGGQNWPGSSFYWNGTTVSEQNQRQITYSVEVTNTSVQAQTVTVMVGAGAVKSQVIAAYQNATLSGTATAADGTVCYLSASTQLYPKSGVPYDTFVVGPANTSYVRAYFAGPPLSEMVNCEVVVQANNIGTAASKVRAVAGSLKLCEVSTAADANGATFVFAKFAGPLPVGTQVGIEADTGYHIVHGPDSSTVAVNNTSLHWVVTVNGPDYRPPYTPDYINNTQVTSYGNGQTITTTPVTGSNTGSGATTVVNTGNLPNNGQTTTVPSGIVPGSTGTNGTPGASVITGGQAGTDTGLLQGILANTAQIAQNTKPGAGENADGLSSEMPGADRLTSGTFQVDGQMQQALAGLNPIGNKGIPAPQAPIATLPFGQLGVDGLTDQTLSFADTNLASWAGVVRTFLLFIVSVLFSYHLLKLISKTIGNL